MLDRKEVEKVMSNRGFYIQMYYRQDGQVTSITCNTMKCDGMDIACIINLEKETFRFEWCVPCSISRLVTPDCGSLFNDTHFDRLYKTIRQQARVLYNTYC